jgi:hypothetical protein
MNPLFEKLIVGLIVLGAVVYAALRLSGARRSRDDSACNACGKHDRVKER